MIYTTEQLDRTTGDLCIVNLGNWITVTELGKQYGLGERKIRSVLHHLGMLKPEKGRFRLTARAVQLGLGKRHDKPKKHQYPFDVISPLGQKIIAENWDLVVADFEQEKQSKPILREASLALARFKQGRCSEITTQMEVCWLHDHFAKLTQDEIAGLIDSPQSLVNRYAKTQAKQRHFHQRRKAAGLKITFQS
jgi:hypothetical protein